MRIFCGFQKIGPDSVLLPSTIIIRTVHLSNCLKILTTSKNHVNHISFYTIFKHIYLDINGSHSMLQYCII